MVLTMVNVASSVLVVATSFIWMKELRIGGSSTWLLSFLPLNSSLAMFCINGSLLTSRILLRLPLMVLLLARLRSVTTPRPPPTSGLALSTLHQLTNRSWARSGTNSSLLERRNSPRTTPCGGTRIFSRFRPQLAQSVDTLSSSAKLRPCLTSLAFLMKHSSLLRSAPEFTRTTTLQLSRQLPKAVSSGTVVK